MKIVALLSALLLCILSTSLAGNSAGLGSSHEVSIADEPVVDQEHRELFLFGGSNDNSVVDLAANAGVFTTLVALLERTELDGVLDRTFGFWFWKRYFTVFAPTDDAFAKIPGETLAALRDNDEYLSHLRGILLYHVSFPFRIFAEDLSDGDHIFTLLGSFLDVNITDGVIKIDDIATVDDELFDLEADNGVVHVIDTVLLPPFMQRTIVDVAIDNSEFFSDLVDAVVAADLLGTLNGPGPFTLFAPTNNAFAKLPNGTLATLIEEDIPTLTNILLYHVVPDSIILRKELTEDVTVNTALEGTTADVSVSSGSWFRRKSVEINDARVFFFDILASNGVVHVIDEVLMPPPTP